MIGRSRRGERQQPSPVSDVFAGLWSCCSSTFDAPPDSGQARPGSMILGRTPAAALRVAFSWLFLALSTGRSSLSWPFLGDLLVAMLKFSLPAGPVAAGCCWLLLSLTVVGRCEQGCARSTAIGSQTGLWRCFPTWSIM